LPDPSSGVIETKGIYRKRRKVAVEVSPYVFSGETGRMLEFGQVPAGLRRPRAALRVERHELRLDGNMNSIDSTQWLMAIVESSDDAIISKNLEGIITSWNTGAERVFGWTAEEAVARSITLVIPAELRDQETVILRRLQAGELIEHFETVRQTKTGDRINVSLTISPVRDNSG
jgi:PAS domain S-box-containing protein